MFKKEREFVPPLILAGGKGWLCDEIYASVKELDLEDACYYLVEQGYDVRMCGVKEVEEFNFMNGQSVFFTSKACKEFIKNNETEAKGKHAI